MTRYITLILIGLASIACSKESTSTGTLSFGIASEDITLNTLSAQTKALSAYEIDNFIVEVPGTDIPSGYYRDIKDEKFVVTAGTYTATACSCTEDVANGTANGADKYGCIRYAGNKEFTVEAGELANVIIPCKATNSKVSVQLKENFLKAIKQETVTVTISTNAARDERKLLFKNFMLPTGDSFSNLAQQEQNWAIAMMSTSSEISAENIRYAYYPAGTTLYINITGQKANRPTWDTVEFDVTQTITTSVACWHKITIDADLSNAPTGISIWVDEIVDVADNSFSIENYNSGNLTEDL